MISIINFLKNTMFCVRFVLDFNFFFNCLIYLSIFDSVKLSVTVDFFFNNRPGPLLIPLEITSS